MLKKLIKFCCLLTILFCIKSTCMASPNISVVVDGNKVNFDQEPIIDNGRTLIPLRGVFDKLNCLVEWDNTNKNVIIKKGNDSVSIKIGENNVYKNGVIATNIDVPAKIINGRAMIPVRGVFEIFDNYVTWSESTKTVEIYSPYGNSVSIDLKKLESANKAFNILENCSNVKKTEFFLGNKSEVTYFRSNNKKLSFHIVNDNFESYSNGENYYEKLTNGNIYEFIYSPIIGEFSKEYFLPEDSDVSWSYNTNENVIFAIEKGDKYYIKTEISDISLIGLDESYGIENKGKYICRLLTDADTLEILSSESYQVIDNIEKNIMSLKIEKNISDDSKFIQDINTSEKCKINVNLKFIDINKEENFKNIDINKGNCFNLFGLKNHNFEVYEDKDCTIKYNFHKKITENSTVNLYIVNR